MFGRAWRWFTETVRWLVAHPGSLVVVSAAMLVGGVAGAPVGDDMFTYMWKDARFCDDCHVHDYANQNWAKSVHGKLTTCHDCHRVPIRHYPKNLFVTLFERPETPEDIPRPEVQIVICEQCHLKSGSEEVLTGPMPAAIRSQVVRIDESTLHRKHLEAKERTPPAYEGGEHGSVPPSAMPDADGIVCLDCHGSQDLQVHRFTAVSESCEVCHGGIRPADERGRALSCLDCHARGFEGGT